MELLASGRDADVYVLDDHTVVRRNRDGRPVHDEAELVRRLGAAGYPVPRVVWSDGPDLVMERIEGPTLAQALLDGLVGVEDGARLLADLHDRLHALSDAPIHLDLHPLNVLLRDGAPVVIDWTNARPGPAGLDVAMTALILAQYALAVPDVHAVVTALLSSFLQAVGDDPAPHLADAVALRRTDPHQTPAELRDLDTAAALVAQLIS